eukprot:jgi/Botrbrau1/21639/Bobra.43_1s0041.1
MARAECFCALDYTPASETAHDNATKCVSLAQELKSRLSYPLGPDNVEAQSWAQVCNVRVMYTTKAIELDMLQAFESVLYNDYILLYGIWPQLPEGDLIAKPRSLVVLDIANKKSGVWTIKKDPHLKVTDRHRKGLKDYPWPTCRDGCAFFTYKGTIYLFDGQTPEYLWSIVQGDKAEWKRRVLTLPQGQGQSLTSRTGFAYFVHEDSLYIHGGSVRANNYPYWYNDLFRLDLMHFKWSYLECGTKTGRKVTEDPLPWDPLDRSGVLRRRNHALWFCDNHLYIFGGLGLLGPPKQYGMDAYITHGDVWRVRIEKGQAKGGWEFVYCFGNLPCPRDDFGHCVTPDGNLYIAGGYTDAFQRNHNLRQELLTAAFKTDAEPQVTPPKPFPILHEADATRSRLNDVFEFNTRRMRWRMLRRGKPEVWQAVLGPNRSGCTMQLYKLNQLIVVGGVTGATGKDTLWGDLITIELDACAVCGKNDDIGMCPHCHAAHYPPTYYCTAAGKKCRKDDADNHKVICAKYPDEFELP